MRFSPSAIPLQPAPPPVDRAMAEPSDLAPLTIASTSPPWPADSPPDDLDERVRRVGEWQLGDW